MATASRILHGSPTRYVPSRSSRGFTRFWVAVALFGSPTVYLLARLVREPTVLEKAYAAAWMVLLAFLGLLQLLTWHCGGLPSIVTGADNRYSTSKLQTALWTLAIGFGLSLLVALAVLDRSIDARQLFGSELKEEYLLLLGGPFGAALLAKGIVGRKVRAGQLQKSKALAPSPSDVAAGDEGNLDLADTQYLFFNLIAMTYFLARLLPNPSDGLPDMPTTLLGLTSAATLGYLGNKAFDNNGPVLTSVVPSSARPSEEVAIRGRHLFPATGAAEGTRPDPAVLFNGVASPAVSISADGTVTAVVPDGVDAGAVDVTVVTSAGVETEPRTMTVREAVPEVPEVPVVPPPPSPPTPAPGPVVVERLGYPPPRDDPGDTDGDDDEHDIPAELFALGGDLRGIEVGP